MASTYNVAVIGTGFAERVQLPGFQRHPRFNLVALAARDPEGTRSAAERFAIARWYTDWREMLGEGGIDLLCITTPPHLHYEMTMAAFDAGMHVLCEKPIALNTEEARQMVARAHETGLTAMIDHEFRYLPARQRFGELVQAGYIGELRRLVFRLHEGWRSDPTRAWNWWSDLSKGGGMLGAIGSHYYDAFRHWFGREPERIWGKLSAFVAERPGAEGEEAQRVTADDSFLAVLALAGGAEVLFDFTSTGNPGPGTTVTAMGSQGTLVMEDDKRLLGAQGPSELQPLELSELPREEGEQWLLAPFVRLLDELVRGMDEGISPSPNLEDGLAHQQFIDAVRISSALGSWVNFPPAEHGPDGVLPGQSTK
ncbi:MAG: Gfo/Idh/MocA family oxidoreductase [Ardenticatenales bacterium]|nr:Gfo/Idh/MocA family oxidoreductase [Ardenticatenales bacterium]